MDFLPSQRQTNHLPPTPNDPRFRRGNNTPCDMLQLAGYCPDFDCPASHQVCFYQFTECSVKCSSIHLDYQLWPSFYNYYNISNELRQQYAHYTNLIGQEQLKMLNRMYDDNNSGNNNNNNNNNNISSNDNNNNIFSGYGNHNINNMREPVPCLYNGFHLQNDYGHQTGLNNYHNNCNFDFQGAESLDNTDNETLKTFLSSLLDGGNYNPQLDTADYSQYLYDPYDPGLVLKQLIHSSFNTNSSYMRYIKIHIGFESISSEQKPSIHNILIFFVDNRAGTAQVAQHDIYTDSSDLFFTQQIMDHLNNLSLDNNTPTTTTTTTATPTRMGTREVSTGLPLLSPSTNDSKPDDCVICLENFVNSNDPKHFLECGHFFHPDCIKDWLNNGGRTCPLCRAGV